MQDKPINVPPKSTKPLLYTIIRDGVIAHAVFPATREVDIGRTEVSGQSQVRSHLNQQARHGGSCL
jgi:hypothetical protein